MTKLLTSGRAAARIIATVLAFAAAGGALAAEGSGWRLLRTPDPRGGSDLVSTVKIADTLRSGPDFAALMVRCGQGGLDVVLALIVPIPPRDRPQIEWRLDDRPPVKARAAVLLPPTTVGLMPEDAAVFLQAAARARRAAFRVINGGADVTAGEVDLGDFPAMIRDLSVQCRLPPAGLTGAAPFLAAPEFGGASAPRSVQ
ncbi:hypothetical protein [Blastochloris sulfoviridis]|uniref:Uncharacterized protein n=1 Tax=Blastochloris sulfoviridis TaxID=50712 RepID=A0A5M6I416_9HYPH|nr:hypothetical protein [Blastochloris sulfoviridis]KAA5602912.1 hypothetical protein F1193_03505 [Blastochloris sulfoviridis]